MPLHITKSMKGVKVGKPRTAAKKTNWPMVRLDFIRENLMPGRTTGMGIYAFIKKYNLDLKQTMTHANEEGWENAVNELRHEMAAQAQRAMMDVAAHTEVEIRHKQARYAALAINKATLKLMTVNPEDLSVKDAIKMLQMGLTEERRAYGMVESVTLSKTDTEAPKQERMTAANQALAILERRRALASMDVLDVESVPVAEQHAG
jgi:hypothetical protein